MLCRIAVQVIDLQGAVAVGKGAGGKRVGAALCPTSSPALGTFLAAGSAGAIPVTRSIAPRLATAVNLVMCLLHPMNGITWRNPSGQVKTVVRGGEATLTGSLPFVSITETLAHGSADFGGFTSAHPNHRVCARYVWKLELIDAGFGVFGAFSGWVVEWSHVLGATNLLKFQIVIADG